MPGIRPPIIAAGINLFGGPLGLIHKHVTGALPIRRNTKDPAYLITLKAYVGELLHTHDLFFYPEGGRSYSGELKPPKTGLLSACLDAQRAGLDARAGGGRLRPGARGSRPGAAEGQAPPARVQPRARRDGALRGRLSQPRVRHVRPADPARRIRRRITAARCWISRTWCSAKSAGSTRCCRRRCWRRRCRRRYRARRSHGSHHGDARHACAPRAPTSACTRPPRYWRRPPNRSRPAASSSPKTDRYRVRDRNVLRYYAPHDRSTCSRPPARRTSVRFVVR